MQIYFEIYNNIINMDKYKTEKAEESLILTEWEERKTRYFPPKC